ncbi:MAG: hypothetical protein AAF692_12125, partial [Pseudomonadota bacterium]
MSENEAITSPLEMALKKATNGGAMQSEAPPRLTETDATGFVSGDAQDIASIPFSDANFERFEKRFGVDDSAPTTFASSFRILRTRVLQSLSERSGQVIGITSPTSRNGKTVASIHLALACARRPEQTVVLADLNLQRPLLSGYLDAREFRSGIGYFRGEGSAEEYLTRGGNGNLLLFLSDRSTTQSAELLSSRRLREALWIRRRQGGGVPGLGHARRARQEVRASSFGSDGLVQFAQFPF